MIVPHWFLEIFSINSREKCLQRRTPRESSPGCIEWEGRMGGTFHSFQGGHWAQEAALYSAPSLLLCQSDLYHRTVHGVLKARTHTHVSRVLYHGTLRASWCRMLTLPSPPLSLSHTSTIGTMGIYISLNTRFILVQGESIHVWYACYMRKYTCIRVFVHRHDLRFRVSQEGATSKTN